MSPDQTRQLIRRWEAEVNAHNIPGLAALYADDAVLTSPMFKTTKGRLLIEATFDRLFTQFPDWTTQVANILVDGDEVAALATASATDRSGGFGLPATGEPFNYRCVLLYTVRDGRIVREERVYDLTAVIDRLEKTRVERELRAASDVQRVLFPRDPQVGEFYEAVGDSIPCRAIGGDFFDFFVIPARGFGVALGDVSGKGPPAALLASLIQGMVAVEASRWQGPAYLLSQLNQALINRGIEPRFVTLSCGMVTRDGALTYANAGHNPPLLVANDGIRQLVAGGPVLGVLADATYAEETVQLSPGDLLVMFSDGMIEAFNSESEEFGDDRLRASLHVNCRLRPAEVVAGALAAVRQFSGGTVHSDDATLMAMRYVGGARLGNG